MAGFRTFVTGEVLTSENVNNFLMKQSVMVFADDAARTAALGAEVTEGMLTFNLDTGALEVFDGAAFVPAAGGGFDDVEVITATNATFSVPALGSPIVKVTVVGGGGGGGSTESQGGAGGATSFSDGVTTLTASGGTGGRQGGNTNGQVGTAGSATGNGGQGGAGGVSSSNRVSGANANGGAIAVKFFNLDGVSTANITVGGGGAGATGAAGNGGAGGRGEVIVEYKAG